MRPSPSSENTAVKRAAVFTFRLKRPMVGLFVSLEYFDMDDQVFRMAYLSGDGRNVVLAG